MLLATMAWPLRADAYSDPNAFSRDPSAETSGGGGGLYFTGSPRSHGLDCSVCHIDESPGQSGLRISALKGKDRWRLFEEPYEPDAIYEIEVAFEKDESSPFMDCVETRAEPCNINLFGLEILDESGRPSGILCPTAPEAESDKTGCSACPNSRAGGTIVEADCTVVMADAFDPTTFEWRNNVTQYSFFWRAPAEDQGPLTLYVSAVDGHGLDKEEGEITSYAGDGVVTFAAELPSRLKPSASSNCSTVSAEGLAPVWAWLGLILAWISKRRS